MDIPDGWKLVPQEPTNDMIAAALQASLDIMKENNVSALSPFTEYPAPGAITRRVYRAMLDAVG